MRPLFLNRFDDEAVINDVIQEIKLIEDRSFKTNIFYVIDPYDLQNYLFPLGLRPEDIRQNIEFEDLLNESLALHSIFAEPECRTFVFDEYIPEFLKFINEIRRRDESDNGRYINFIKEKTKNVYEDNFIDIQKKLAIYSVFSIGVINGSINTLKSLIDNKRIIVNSRDLESLNLPIEFTESFEKNRPDKLYDQFWNYIKNATSDNTTNINQWIDCRAADRIISVNNYLEELFLQKKIDQRYVLLYLSSTRKMQSLFSSRMVKRNLPIINGSKFNIHRNTAQLYFRLIYNSSDKKNFKWQELKDIFLNKTSNTHFLEENNAKFDRLIDQYCDYVLLSQKNRYISELVAAKDAITAVDFKTKIDTLIRKAEKIDEKELMKDIKNILSEIKIDSIYRKIYEGIINETNIQPFDGPFDGISDFDNIIGKGSIFPILFRGIKTEKLQKVLIDIINYIIGKTSSFESRKIKFILESNNTNNFYSENNLVLCLFIQLLKSNRIADPAKAVLDEIDLDNIYNTNISNELKSDYCYLASCLARRVKKYKDALNFAFAIQKYSKNDSRHFQALGLIYYSQAVDSLANYLNDQQMSIDRNKIISLLEESLSNFDNSLKHKPEPKTFNTLFYNEVYYATLNSVAYINALLSHWEENQEKANKFLEIARLKTEELFDLLQQDNFDKYPEYIHTQAYICVEEYKKYKAYRRLKEARALMDNVIEIDPRNNDYKELSVFIDDLLIQFEQNSF